MKQKEGFSQEDRGRKKDRVKVEKSKKIPILFLNTFFLGGNSNRTIHNLIWKTYKDKNKTKAMSDHQHRKYS